jgi:trigger factor
VKTEVKPAAENEVTLTIEVPVDTVKKMYERTLSRLQREASIPGFRKGHVPRQLVVQRLGEEYVRNEAVQDALPEWYDEALGEADVDAVSMPQLDVDFEKYSVDAPFTFSATVQVRPTPVLGEYKGLEVPRRTVEVSDGQVEAQLAMLQERLASLKPVEGRPVQKGDFVLMDLAGESDGEPIEGAEANDYMTEVGRGNLIPGFEEALEGVLQGEEKMFDVTFPDDYHAEELQGQPATFTIKVKEIKEKVTPELDDAFAADVSEFETMDDLRADVRSRLEAAAEAGAQREFRAAAVDAAVANAQVTVPPAMIEREAHHLYHELEESVGERGMTMDVYLGVLDKTPEQVEEELKPQAETIIKRRLVLDAIAAAEELSVSDDEITEVVKRDAEALGRDYLQLLADLRESGRQEAVRDEMLLAKAVDLVADSSVAVPVSDAAADSEDAADETGEEQTADA